jgi:sugar O-acyltransferase (sialic acid O-acetyltransferase NeuD family)
LLDLLIIGAGGHAVSCIDVIEEEGRFDIAGLIASPSEVGNTVCDYKVIGTDQDLPLLRDSYSNILIAIGQISTPRHRLRLAKLASSLNYELPSIISPRAYLSKHASVGFGTIVMPGVVINAKAVIGDNCIINSSVIIEHESWIGSNCHISTGVIVNGGVRIGRDSFVGSGSIIKQGISIERGSVVGMGSIVKNDWVNESKLGSIDHE